MSPTNDVSPFADHENGKNDLLLGTWSTLHLERGGLVQAKAVLTDIMRREGGRIL